MPFEKLMPDVGDVFSLLVLPIVPRSIHVPLLIFVIKWSTPPGAATDAVVWLWTLLGVWERVGGADSTHCSEPGVWASKRPPHVCCWKLYHEL